MTEPITADEVGGPPDPNAPAVAQTSRPIGIAATFGWTICAFGTGTFAWAATLVVFALANFWRQPDDADIRWFADVATIVGEATFLAVILWACRRRGWRAADYVGLTRPRGNYLRWSLLACLLAEAVSIAIANVGALGDPSVLVNLFSSATSVFLVVVVAPIGEELVFRGFLFRGIAASRLGIVGAILITSLSWAGIHTDRAWLGFADIFFTGLLLGGLRWRTDSTVAPIAVHGFKNIVATLMYFLHP
jgi:hypothetical protein